MKTLRAKKEELNKKLIKSKTIIEYVKQFPPSKNPRYTYSKEYEWKAYQ